MDSVFLTKFGYGLIPASCIAAIIVIYIKLKTYGLLEETKGLLLDLSIWLFVVGIRVGWFAFSRKFPTDGFTVNGEPHNEFMWSNKHLMAITTGVIFAVFTYRIMTKIKRCTHIQTLLAVSTVVLVALWFGW